jgi:hypothetical protein
MVNIANDHEASPVAALNGENRAPGITPATPPSRPPAGRPPRRVTCWPASGSRWALLTVLMWTAVLPPATNPFMDDHLVYAAVLVLLALLGAGNTWGLGRRWAATPFVRRNTWLT